MESRGKRIRAAREAIGMKAADLARACSVNPTTLWKWETDMHEGMAAKALVALAEALGVSATWLQLGGDPPVHIAQHIAKSLPPTGQPREAQS